MQCADRGINMYMIRNVCKLSESNDVKTAKLRYEIELNNLTGKSAHDTKNPSNNENQKFVFVRRQ